MGKDTKEKPVMIGILAESDMRSGSIYFEELKYLICRALQLEIYWKKLHLTKDDQDMVHFNELFDIIREPEFLKSVPVLTNGREPRDNA